MTELTFDWKQQHSKFWLMINFRLNYHSLPSAVQCNSLGVKRVHYDISSVSAD